MAFTLKMSAFLSAEFHRYLTEAFGEQGRNAFLYGFRHYANQRGERIAQRCIREGLDMTYENYIRFHEVISSEDMKSIDGTGSSDKISYSPHYISHVHACPVGNQFREMGASQDAIDAYCQHIDIYVCGGFNPEIDYNVDHTKLQKDDYCVHRVMNANIDPNKKLSQFYDHAGPFPYIVANFYFSMREALVAIFDEKGAAIADRVKDDFIREYGQEDWDVVAQYKETNFNVFFDAMQE